MPTPIQRTRELVSKSGLTVEEFAAQALMDAGRLSAILSGERAPTSLDLAKVATAARVTVEWLLGDDYRQHLAEALIARIRESVVPDSPFGHLGSARIFGATEHDLADAVLAVRDEEIEKLRAQTAYEERWTTTVIEQRDSLEVRLDRFAYAVAPVEVIGEHSSANDPWQNALDLLTPAVEVNRLREEAAYAVEALNGAENRRQMWRERAEKAEAAIARVRTATARPLMHGPNGRHVIPLDLLTDALEGRDS